MFSPQTAPCSSQPGELDIDIYEFSFKCSSVAWNDFKMPNSRLEAVRSDLCVVLVTM